MKCNVLFPILILSLTFIAANSQKLPKSNLILFQLQQSADKVQQFVAPRFLTAFNLEGYNNQPFFFSNSELYLTSQSKTDTTQSDIVALDVFGGQKIQVTATAEPEYSATSMPNGTHFSCVRVDEDGAQRLWAYPLNRDNSGYNLFEWHKNVGYHCWLSDEAAALFLVGTDGKNHQLVMADQNSRNTDYIASNPGRCIAKTKSNDLLFVVKATEKTWFIKRYDPIAKTSKIVISTRPQSEDFCLLPDGTILMGEGSKVFQYRPGTDATWRLSADLSKYGIKKVTRMATNGEGKVAVVVE